MITTKCFVFRFSDVEVHEQELRATRGGQPLEIEPKAFRVLVYLVQHAGHLVSKSELMDAVWGETAVTENSLTRAIALLRRVLEDDPHQPRFIETVSTAGYRFICTVETEEPSTGDARTSEQTIKVAPISGSPTELSTAKPCVAIEKPRSWFSRRWILAVAAGVLAAIGMTIAWWEWSTPAVPSVASIEPLTHDGLSKVPPVTDGARVYFSEALNHSQPLAQVSVTGGEVSTLATPFSVNVAWDIAPDKSSLLVSDFRWNEPSSLWRVPLPQGAPRRLGNMLVDSAAWFPDGSGIVFIKGTEIWRANPDGSQPRKILTASGVVLVIRVSPDGKRMRYTAFEQAAQPVGSGTYTLWEANTDGSGAHPLLPEQEVRQIAGSWSPDGRYYIFGVDTARGGVFYGDLWLLPERRSWLSRRRPSPVQLTSGPLSLNGPVAFSSDGRTLFCAGGEQRGELMRFDPETHQTAPYLSGIPAIDVVFSRDGQWMTYITWPDFSLWRSRSDGSVRLQLTSSADYSDIPRWSPDGSKIAFQWSPSAQKLIKLAIISRDGGVPEQVIPNTEDSHSQMDPTWSPDGNEIIFSRHQGLSAVEHMELLRVNLKTRKVTSVPGSEGLYGPRWSPDGRYLAAEALDSRSIHLFDFRKQVWKTWFKAGEGHVGWHVWSPDSKALFFWTDKGDHLQWWRIALGEQMPTKIADLPDERIVNSWSTVAPDGKILYTRDMSTSEIYALHLSEK